MRTIIGKWGQALEKEGPMRDNKFIKINMRIIKLKVVKKIFIMPDQEVAMSSWVSKKDS